MPLDPFRLIFRRVSEDAGQRGFCFFRPQLGKLPWSYFLLMVEGRRFFLGPAVIFDFRKCYNIHYPEIIPFHRVSEDAR